MTDVSARRRLAAKILKAGVHRVWIDPEKLEQVSSAITRRDIKNLIDKGIIGKKQKKGTSRFRARERAVKKRKGKVRGEGGKRGAKYSIVPKKRRWINTIRPLRRYLRALKLKGLLNTKQFRHLYKLSKGGFFRNKAHLKIHLGKEGIRTK